MTIAKPEKPLPKGWRYAKLGEVCVQDRQTIAPNDPIAKTLEYISLENVESNSGRIIISNDAGAMSDIRGNAFQFDSRHVLYGKLRPYLNKVALPYSPGRCTTELVPLLPTQIDREYLALYLRTPKAVDWAMQGKTGSRMPRTDMTEFMKLSIPLPPLAEQRRIVAALEAQLAAVARARNAAAEILSAVEALNGALMRKFLPLERQKLPRGWKWVTLGEVCQAIRGVTFKSGQSREFPAAGYIACVTTSAVQEVVDWYSRQYIPLQSVKGRNQVLQVGDILVSTANSKALVGKSCQVNAVPEDCTFGAFVTVLRPQQIVLSDWLSAIMKIDDAKRYFYEISSNTTNISNLRVQDLLKYQMPLPPLAEQRRIVAALEAQTGAADGAKRAAAAALNELRELPGSLLRQAFAGETG